MRVATKPRKHQDLSFSVSYLRSSLAADFPPRPSGTVPPVEHVPCRIYFPRYSMLGDTQRAYFVYWRQQYEAGTPMPCDPTYRYLYLQELVTESVSPEGLEQDLSKLFERYDDASFRRNVPRWIGDLSLQRGNFPTADLSYFLEDPILAFAIAIHRKTPPPMKLLMSLYSKGHVAMKSVTVTQAMPTLEAMDTGSVLFAAEMAPATQVRRTLFQGLQPAAESFSRFGALVVPYSAVEFTPYLQFTIDTVVETAMTMIGQAIFGSTAAVVRLPTADPEVTLVEAPMTAVDSAITLREQIVLRAVAPLPTTDTLDGVLWYARGLMSQDAAMVLAVVLCLSTRKPYIEGKIAFSAELREACDTFATAFGKRVTIGTMRNAFYTLGTGPRKIWMLEPEIEDRKELRSGKVAARFSRPLQAVLAGSDARDRLLEALFQRIGTRAGGDVTPERVLAVARESGLLS